MIDSTDKDRNQPSANAPLGSLDEWEDDLLRRYPKPAESAGPVSDSGLKKKPAEFRDHETSVRPSVREFYRLNHT
jgi:inositol oxygenase